MRPLARLCAASLAITILFAVFLLLPVATAQETFSISSTEVHVFRDGVARVAQSFNVNETLVSISVVLLSSSVENVLVLDDVNMPVSYELTPPNITITTLGATKVTLDYLTSTLTRKEGEAWTLNLNTPYEATITLPKQSNIIFINELPPSIAALNDRTVLVVGEGVWEISYTLPITLAPITTPAATTPTTTTTPTVTETTTPEVAPAPLTTPREAGPVPTIATPFPLEYLAVAIVVAFVGGFLVLRRRRPGTAELRSEDKQVLDFISEKGGKVLESELRQKLILPRSSTWRLAKRLERLGYVKISKIGIQNEIELVRGRFASS